MRKLAFVASAFGTAGLLSVALLPLLGAEVDWVLVVLGASLLTLLIGAGCLVVSWSMGSGLPQPHPRRRGPR